MKKTIHLIFALIIFSLSVSAQITLTQSDLPVAGTAYIVGADSAYNAAITPGGANQSWDYSGLVNSVQDTIGFIAASTSPYASNFPLANLASHNVVDSMWTFFISNPTGFYINGAYSYGSSGVGGLSNIPLVYNPSQLFEPVPFTYTNTRNDVSRFRIDLDTLGQHLRLVHRMESVFDADGYGSLILPNATYPNTLRIKTIGTAYDSVFVDLLGIGFYTLVNSTISQSSNYRWFRNGQPAYLLGMNGDSLGNQMNYSEYLLNNGTIGITEQLATVKFVTVYPNPATAQINFVLPEVAKENTTLKIFNAEGKLVRETVVDGLNGYGFNTTYMETGLYLYSIVGVSTNYQGRFIVSH